MEMKYSSRYTSDLAKILDLVSFLLVYPCVTLCSLAVSCYLPTFREKQEKHPNLYLRFLLYGPFLVGLFLVSIPLVLVGFPISVLVCQFSSKPYSLLQFEDRSPDVNQLFTFGTMNLLLGHEALGRFNNISSVYSRVYKFAEIILGQDKDVLKNMQKDEDVPKEMQKEDSVLVNFPQLDFICFQEVHDRFFALALISQLRRQYSHFIFDVSVNSTSTNMYLMGSGLMLASRYPILATTFHPFSTKRGWQHSFCYGVLVTKLDLGGRRVGILANLHTMAYQGSENLIDVALTEVLETVEKFKSENVSTSETLLFDVIGGDFNIDNMSPGDLPCAENKLLKLYRDPATIRPGLDAAWAVGTERRQLTMARPEAVDPASFREILVDDVRRRHYVLDADVEQQTFDLMVVEPKTDEKGEVGRQPWGGMRRIDRLVYMDNLGMEVVGAASVSAVAGLTDHVPVVLSLGLTNLKSTLGEHQQKVGS